jgi:formate hydrogenlyase subunit 6/NADH:ubiquinone oxidoreductase subunit I
MSFFSMTKTIIGNLLAGPVTRPYPFVAKTYFENTRGRVLIAIGKCIFCGICQKRCPTNAIRVNRNEKTWTINRFACTACGNCIDNCPKDCLANDNHYAACDVRKSEETFTAPSECSPESLSLRWEIR